MTDTRKTTEPQTIKDQDLDQASGGIGMLLPAVQAARESIISDKASPKLTKGAIVAGDGSV